MGYKPFRSKLHHFENWQIGYENYTVFVWEKTGVRCQIASVKSKKLMNGKLEILGKNIFFYI